MNANILVCNSIIVIMLQSEKYPCRLAILRSFDTVLICVNIQRPFRVLIRQYEVWSVVVCEGDNKLR